MAILKSDEVLEYIVKDKKNFMQFKNLYSENNFNFREIGFDANNILITPGAKAGTNSRKMMRVSIFGGSRSFCRTVWRLRDNC